MIYLEAISGIHESEFINAEKGSPQFALQDFYHAFNTGNLEQMSENWLQTEQVSMSNPLGGVRRGWSEIEPVYKRIFTGQAKVYVEFYDYSIHQQGHMFCAVGRERGYFQLADKKLELAIRTTRVYQRVEGRWLHLHHHGSIESPDLLGAYQSSVIDQ